MTTNYLSINNILQIRKSNLIFTWSLIFAYLILICNVGQSQPNLLCSSTDDTGKFFTPKFAIQGLENDKLIYGKVKENSSSNMSNGFIRKLSNDCSSSETMEYDFSPNEELIKIFLTDEGNMLTLSQTINTENGSSFTYRGVGCLLLNYEGDVLEENALDNEVHKRALTPTLMSNNKVLISLEHRSPNGVGIAVFNQDCSLDWEVIFPEYLNIWAYEISGHIYAVCTPQMTSQERYLLKLTLDGQLLSTTPIETDFLQFMSFVRKTSDDHLIINSGDQSVSGKVKGVLTKIDVEGNTVWEQSFFDEDMTNQITGIVDLPDGNMLAYSSFWSYPNKKLKFFKLDNLGETIWEKDYGGYDRNQYLIVKVINNDFILLGYTSNDEGDDFEHYGSKDIILQSIDSNGETNWIKSYGIFSDEIIEELIVEGDEIFVSGERIDKSYAQFLSCKQGEPCDDGDPETMFDEIVEDCLCQGVTDCEHPDYDALVTFYNSLGGDGWTYSGTADNHDDESNGWVKDCDVCDWFGVTCENDRVTRIYLYENNLQGSIPSEIMELEELKSLILEKNNISGSLPTEIGSLEHLEHIILFDNELSGDIPEELYDATNLISIDLTANNFSGPLSDNVGMLTDLEHLKLGHNELVGELPSVVGELLKLKTLEVRFNHFNGFFPVEIGNLSDLERILAGWNDFSGEIPDELFMLKKLFLLELSGNNFSDTLSASITEATQLFGLFLNENNLYGSLPENIGELSNLTILHLNENDFSGEIPESLGNMMELHTLYLENNNLSGCIPQSLEMLCGNTEVDISNNPNLDTDSWDAFCENSSGICPDIHPDYYTLVSFYNSTVGPNWTNKDGWESGVLNKYSDPCQWYGIDCNENLRVSCIDLDGDPGCTMSGGIGNNLSGIIPDDIGDLTFLENLNLSNNLVESTIPDGLYALENLTSLNLDGNKFTGGVSSEISNLTEVININLSNNELGGPLPNSIGQLIKLEYLNLENALISDEIPIELGDLQSIKMLNLSNNNLQGEIPATLANLTNVIQIELSNNNLSGCLDPAFKGWCDNVDVDLSQNILLPWLGDFEAFCNSSGELSSQIGAECSDGDLTNGEEEIIEDCSCAMVVGTSNIDNAISLYPNPVNSKLIVEGLEDRQLYCNIYNVLGVKVKTIEVVNNSIQVEDLIDGVYLFQIFTEGYQSIYLEKVVVSNK